MAEPELTARNTESRESCPQLTDEFFENIAQSVDLFNSEGDGRAKNDNPKASKEMHKSDHSESRERVRGMVRTDESCYRQISQNQSQQQARFQFILQTDNSNSTVSSIVQNVVINNIAAGPSASNFRDFALQASGPPLVMRGQRIMPGGPNFINRRNFIPQPNFMPRSDFMNRANFQPRHSNSVNPNFIAQPNFMLQQNLPPVESPASPPPILLKPPENDEHAKFLEVRRRAFGKDKFLENLRRISEQTSKKEAEVEAKMKAERQQTSKKKAEVEAKMKAKREEERVRAEQAEKAKRSRWTPVEEPSTKARFPESRVLQASTGEIQNGPSLSNFMAIMPLDYPTSIIRRESYNIIEKNISIAMTRDRHKGFNIDIRNMKPLQGVVGVTCGDLATASWLASFVSGMESSFKCKPVREAQLLPSFELFVYDPTAVFEQVQRSIAQKQIFSGSWTHLISYDVDKTRPKPGKKFFFLGDYALRKRLKKEKRIIVQLDQTKASITYLRGIGEGSFETIMKDRWVKRKRKTAREIERKKNLQRHKKASRKAPKVQKEDQRKDQASKDGKLEGAELRLHGKRKKKQLKKELAKLRRATSEAEREVPARSKNLQELDAQNRLENQKMHVHKAMQRQKKALASLRNRKASVAHRNEASVADQQGPLAKAPENNLMAHFIPSNSQKALLKKDD